MYLGLVYEDIQCHYIVLECLRPAKSLWPYIITIVVMYSYA